MLATARIIAELDLVISVDTAIAHLALSMGKPTWVLLATSGRDYRWNDAVHSDWYTQARLFRQSRPGDWSGVLDEVELALTAADSPVAMSP
jgi:ADP-heptose:LPS heptosyltransferase